MKATSAQHAQLLRKFHTICSITGINKEGKDAILAGYGVESSRDLTEIQLVDIINALNREPEAWRRRVMASIGAWLRSINKTDNADAIKGIACRAAQISQFNQIPISRLRDIYYEFSRKAKTSLSINRVMAEEINNLTCKN